MVLPARHAAANRFSSRLVRGILLCPSATGTPALRASLPACVLAADRRSQARNAPPSFLEQVLSPTPIHEPLRKDGRWPIGPFRKLGGPWHSWARVPRRAPPPLALLLAYSFPVEPEPT